MKGAFVFLSVLGLALGEPEVKTWPLNELYDALENLPKDSPMSIYANEAVNFIFNHIRRDYKEQFGHIILPSPSGAAVWTKEELEKAAENIVISPVLGFYAQPALERLSEENTAQMLIPAVDISTWTAADLFDALKNPNTNPGLLPYLKKAEKIIGTGDQKEVTIVTPLGLVSSKAGSNYPLGYVFQSIYVIRR